MHELDTRKGLGITLLAGALIALGGCGGEAETTATSDATAGETAAATASGGSEASAAGESAAAASLAGDARPEADEEEMRRRFREAALRRTAESTGDGPQTKEAAGSTGALAARVGATAPTPAAPTPAATSAGLGTRPATGTAPATREADREADVAPAEPAADSEARPAFNMTGGFAGDDIRAATPARRGNAAAAAAAAGLPLGTAGSDSTGSTGSTGSTSGAAAPSRMLGNTASPGERQAMREQEQQQQEQLSEQARRAKMAALEARQARRAGDTTAPRDAEVARDAAARAALAAQDAERAAGREPAPIPARADDPPAVATTLTLDPPVIEYGDIALGESKTATVRLVNDTDRDYRLIDCRATCGCTATQCPKGNTIAAGGGSVEVEVQLDGGERPQTLRKTVNFLISDGHPPLRLALEAEAVAFVTASPERLDRGQHPDGAVTITADDGTPFRVLSMFPAVLTPEELPQEAKTEHVINVPWDALYESGTNQRRLLFRLDHPKSERILIPLSVNVLRDMRERARSNDASEAVVSRPPVPARQLNSLLNGGEIDAVLDMIETGEVVPNQPDDAGHTPLIKAARFGVVEVVAALADRGANLEATDGMGRTPLCYAAQSGSLDTVLMLLDLGANVRHVDQTGNTPLAWAAGFGTLAMCEAMIEAGAEVDSGSGTLIGFTPLIWAASVGEDVDKVKLLLERDADVEARDTMEQATVVMHAIRTNKRKHVEVLLQAGAKLDVTDARGNTPLHIAARSGEVDHELVELLLERGLDPAATNRKGETPLDLARKRTDERAAEVVARLEAAVAGG